MHLACRMQESRDKNVSGKSRLSQGSGGFGPDRVRHHRSLGEVGQTIEPCGEHFWRNGHSVRMIVFDDSSPLADLLVPPSPCVKACGS